jgi:CxxC motif-containing protein
MKVELDDKGGVVSVSGNACKRGAAYADAECTNPTRTVTSTVRCASGGVVAVKTAAPIPKGKIFEVMKEINRAVAPAGVRIGDVVIENVSGTGVSIVATSND